MDRLRLLLLASLLGVVVGGYPASNYGPPKYQFLPAPPGKTPPCAKYGSTYCEKIDNYPEEHIRYLLYKYGKFYEPFLVSETNQEYKPPVPYGGYDYTPVKSYYPVYTYNDSYQGYGPPNTQYGQPVQFESKPTNNYPYQEQRSSQIQQQYQQQQSSQQVDQFGGQLTPPAVLPQQGSAVSMSYTVAPAPPVTQSYWWNHRDSNNQPLFPYISEHVYQAARRKRQAAAETLCPARNRAINPRAAMNRNGVWMFVVNEAPEESRYRQQVVVEECINPGQPCSGICTLPGGYTSSCTQKTTQKRLVALDPSGESLMQDTFFFPSCCTCSIAVGG